MILRCLITLLSLIGLSLAQTAGGQQPQIKVNYLNVCAPSTADRADLETALRLIPAKPAFAVDMEVARGRAVNPPSNPVEAGDPAQSTGKPVVSRWVRIRRDMADVAPVSNVQYSFSVAEAQVNEILVLHSGDPKEFLQISLSDEVNAPSDPATVVKLNTPVDRIRLERFGKSSVVLARCPGNQDAYESIFKSATELMAGYRRLLGVPGTVPQELTRLGGTGTKKTGANQKRPDSPNSPAK